MSASVTTRSLHVPYWHNETALARWPPALAPGAQWSCQTCVCRQRWHRCAYSCSSRLPSLSSLRLSKTPAFKELPSQQAPSPAVDPVQQVQQVEDTIELDKGWFIAQLVALVAFLPALNAAFLPWLWELGRAVRQRRTWTLRRKHLVLESFIKGVTLNVMLVVGVAAGATQLAHPHTVCRTSYVLQALLFVHWQVSYLSAEPEVLARQSMYTCKTYQWLSS